MPRIALPFAMAFCLAPVSLLSAQNERLPETFQVALGMQQRGMHEEAARYFSQFVDQSPRHPLRAEAHYRAGVSQAAAGAARDAVRSLQSALQRGGENFRLKPECRYRLGNLLQEAEEHAAAATQFEALGKEVKNDHYLRAPAWFAAGECRRELGDDGKAAVAFAASVESATGEQREYLFPGLYQLGFCLRRVDALPEAATVFARAAEAAPDAAAQGECRYLEGDTLLRLEKYGPAREAFTAALRVESDFRDDAQFGLGWVALGQDDQEAARAAFAAVVGEHRDSPLVGKARLELGRSWYRAENYEACQRALTPLTGNNVAADLQREARELLGLCALATGAGEQAVATLQKSISEAAAADRPRLSFALGEAHANLGQWQEAAAAYAKVPAGAGPELFGDALYGHCFALHMLGAHEQSNDRARALLALQPAHRLAPHARFAVAENLFLMQDYPGAAEVYGALEGSDEFGERAAWKLAWCAYLQDDKQNAAARFGRLAASDAGFAEEALAMTALALLEAGNADAALTEADRYRARYREGAFLDRTERVAARVLRQRGNLAGARRRLERAAAAAGNEQEATGDRLEQAELAYQEGDYEAADGLFEPLMGRDDATGARAIAGRAWCAFELGDDERCSALIARGLGHPHRGEVPGLLELQSAVCHRQSDWPGAIEVAQTYLRSFADHSKAPAMRYALGVAQARNEDHAAARATLAALERDGGYERPDRVQYELAWACRRAGQENEALAAFARLLVATKDEELAGEARLHLGVAALENDKTPEATGLLAAVRGSHRGRALYQLAFAEFERSESQRGAERDKTLSTARTRFDEVAGRQGEPLAGEALYLGAECSQKLGDHEGAVARARRLLDAMPDHERGDRARLVLGESAVALGQGDLAVPALERFLRDGKPEGTAAARAHLALGRARLLRGECKRAESSFQKVTAISEGPLGAEAQYRIGEARQQDGNLQGAADAFVKLPILYAHEEWVRKGLLAAGMTYQQLRQPQKASRFFEELQSKYPDSPEAAAAKARQRNG